MNETFDSTKKNNATEVKRGELPEEILLAEDNDDLRMALTKYILEPRGYKVLAVENGELLLDQLKHDLGAEAAGPDIIITDNNMPGIGGLQILDKIRNDPEYARFKDLPVIVNTGDSVRKEVEELGGIYFLKGNPKEFLALIESELAKRKNKSLESKE